MQEQDNCPMCAERRVGSPLVLRPNDPRFLICPQCTFGCPNDKHVEPKQGAPKGSHLDAGKVRVDLVPRAGIVAAARAMAWGLTKYEEHNYLKGLRWMGLYASIMRHLLLWAWEGSPDDESGLSHLDHAAADTLMLCAIVEKHPDLDDRPIK